MTIRSMPPASSHFADRPVPAPPPTIGTRRSIMSGNRSRIGSCGKSSARVTSSNAASTAAANFGFVDVVADADDLAVLGLHDPRLDGREQRLVGLGIVERLSRRIEQRDATFRQQEPDRRRRTRSACRR